MPDRFLIKDIAFQAGVGTATVDRVLNRRGNVRQHTVDRVRRAIAELEQQRQQLAMSGRRMVADVIAEAPQNFIDALEEALAVELPLMRPAAFRVRKALRTDFPVAQLEDRLARTLRHGSDGVILMAPESTRLKRLIDRLEETGIPVVTLATDMPDTARSAYVGLDNRVAGATAAWFLGRMLEHLPHPRVLVTQRNMRFRGEEERATGFTAALADHLPGADQRIAVEGRDRRAFLTELASLATAGPFDGIYSIGGGNGGLLKAVPQPRVFVAHDLDPENRALFRAGRIDMLLYHDLAEDTRAAARIIMARHLSGDVPLPLQNAALRVLLAPMAGGIAPF